MKPARIFLASILAVIFSGVTFYFMNCRTPEIHFTDALGTWHSADISKINRQNSIREKLTGDYNRDINYLDREIEKYDQLYYAAEYVDGYYSAIDYFAKDNTISPETEEYVYKLYEDYRALYPMETEEEISHKILDETGNYEAVKKEVSDCGNYNEYVVGIAENARTLMDISLYKDNQWMKNNFIKTQRDYYALEGIKLSPQDETGYMAVLCFWGADLAAVLLTLFVGIYLAGFIKTGNKYLLLQLAVWSIGILMIYIVCFIISGVFLGLPDFGTSIQSIKSFRTCQYTLSCGIVAVLWVLFKMAGFAFLLFGGMFLYSRRKRIPGITLFFLVVVGERLILSYKGSNPLFIFLREVNFFSAFSLEKFFLRYLNLNFFSMSVSSFTAFLVFFIPLSALLWIMGYKGYVGYAMEAYDKMQREYYDEIDRRYNESRKIRHDINNHLLALRFMIEKGDVKGASKYIGEVSEQLDMSIMPVKTGSDVLDALLYQKTVQAKEKGIELSVQMECPPGKNNISDYDLCGIFGNIIDNALEASRNVEKPSIKLFVGSQHNMLFISCENAYLGELRKKGNVFHTTKESSHIHGIGLKRVKELAEKNGGDISINSENNRFIIEILLNGKNII